MRPYVLAPITLGALILGYLWGYGVGEREGQDSDPEQDALDTHDVVVEGNRVSDVGRGIRIAGWQNGG